MDANEERIFGRLDELDAVLAKYVEPADADNPKTADLEELET